MPKREKLKLWHKRIRKLSKDELLECLGGSVDLGEDVGKIFGEGKRTNNLHLYEYVLKNFIPRNWNTN